jgi:Exostosin family
LPLATSYPSKKEVKAEQVTIYLDTGFHKLELRDHYLCQARVVANTGNISEYILTNDPEKADLIIFYCCNVMGFEHELIMNPLVRKYPEKCFLYTEEDYPLYILPSVCASASRTWLFGRRTLSYCYLSSEFERSNPFVTNSNIPRDLLFSFLGSPSSRLRKKLLALAPHRSDCIVEDTSYYIHHRPKDEAAMDFQRRYAKIMSRSRFALCPRGCAPSSYRIFESMKAGCVPVIISDNWLPPKGPDWESFALFIPEKKIHMIESIIASEDDSWQEKSLRAREAWERHFAPEMHWRHIVESCLELGEQRMFPERLMQKCHWAFRLSWYVRTGIRRDLLRFLRSFLAATHNIVPRT